MTTPDLRTTRIFYSAAPGIAMLLAFLVQGIFPNRLRHALAGLLVLLCSMGILHNLSAWRYTSNLEAQFLTELKALAPSPPPPHAEFVFHDLPTSIRGVYFLEAGLRDSIRMTLGRDDLTARRGDGVTTQPQIHIEWLGKPDQLIASVPLRTSPQ